MKITYRREMKHNYMIVDPESLTWRNYECRMLAANSIEGVLHFQIRQVDDEIRFYYEITSRQPLDRMLESRSVHTEELRSIVFGISRALDKMEQYLLPEGSVLLTPEHIYVEPETFRIWLCLVPGLERSFPEDYGKLLEYLLGKVDHQDKESVVLAYGLYQETRKENYGMEDILRLFGSEKGEAPGMGAEDAKAEDTNAQDTKAQDTKAQELLFLEKAGQRENGEGGKRSRRKKRDGKVGAEKGQGDARRSGLWSRLKEWWGRRRDEKEPEAVQVPWEMMFHEEDMADVRVSAEPGERQAASGPLYLGQSDSDWRRRQKKYEGEMPRRSSRQREKELINVQEPERMIRLGQVIQSGQATQPGQVMQPGQAIQPGQAMQPKQPGQVIQPGQDTVLLADLSHDTRTKLRCLRALDAEGEDIVISYYPFIIGKQENLVDYLLSHDTVSRLHLRIDRDEDRYFVQDLNSTNGTTLEGRLLDNNELAEIHEGDEIRIARYRYRFE